MGEESMVERVARFMGYAPGDREGRMMARAAIEAMRQPTNGMMRIVRERHDFRDASIYTPFIEAALQDPTSKEQEKEG